MADGVMSWASVAAPPSPAFPGAPVPISADVQPGSHPVATTANAAITANARLAFGRGDPGLWNRRVELNILEGYSL